MGVDRLAWEQAIMFRLDEHTVNAKKIPWLVVSSTENRMLFKLSAGGSALQKHADYWHQRNESHVGVEEKGQSDHLIGW